MEQTTFGISNKILYSAIAVILLLWGLAGLREVMKIPYTGYLTSPDNVVTVVRADSPEASAGLKAGDQVTKIDGISVASGAGLAQRGRPAIGSPGSLSILRNGNEQTLNFRYAERPTSDLLLFSGVGIIVGLASLILGLLVYLRNPTRKSSLLCLLLLAFAAIFLPQPYFSSVTARGLVGALFSIIVSCFVALLLLYCLHFPHTKRILAERAWLGNLIVLIALIPGVIIAYLNIARPDINNNASLMLNVLFGVFYGGLFLCSLLAILHSFIKVTAAERTASGLNWMLAGVILGLAPITLSILLSVIFPRIGELPWDRLTGVLFLAIPICFALALMKLEPVHQTATEEATA